MEFEIALMIFGAVLMLCAIVFWKLVKCMRLGFSWGVMGAWFFCYGLANLIVTFFGG